MKETKKGIKQQRMKGKHDIERKDDQITLQRNIEGKNEIKKNNAQKRKK